MKFKLALMAVPVLFLLALPPAAGAGALLADLENALMCKCDDKCGKVLINCTCSTSDKTRAEFTRMLESGLTVEQIIQKQVDQYGETVLSAPTKNGFNLTAWVAPFAALLVGGLGIRKVIDNWVRKNRGEPGETESGQPEPAEAALSDKIASRIKSELDEIEQ
ncbi:MAG: cytochrome c-type biogenesis protein CcmH [Nitrospinaceae bacterium]|jgi:cytochrome c-type biogenesis protein CcmH|nr:MAG: cytochrome c-type biogenesis protein CcmH [Nitrospinaceae bacterium]